MLKLSWLIIEYVVNYHYVFGLLNIFVSCYSHGIHVMIAIHPTILPHFLFSLLFFFFHHHPYNFIYFKVPLYILYLPSSTFTSLLSPYMLSLCMHFFFSILPTFFSLLSFLTYNSPFLFLSHIFIILLISPYFHHLLSIY